MSKTPNPATEASPPGDFANLARLFRAAAEPARIHAISFHDASGEMLWLSESSMGPDEHDAVREAAESFTDPKAPLFLVYDLGDGRAALLIRAVNAPQSTLGLAMLITDTRTLPQGEQSAAKLMTLPMHKALLEFARLRVSSTARGRVIPHEPSRPAAAVTPQVDRLNAALRSSPICLFVQRLVPLTKGIKRQRYEVLLRSKSDAAPSAAPHAMLKSAVDHGLGSMIDRRVVCELIAWLLRHPHLWQDDRAMFSINLTTTALYDEHFIKFVELCVAKGGLPAGLIAFEVDVATALRPRVNIAAVAIALHRIGCPLVLDDFNLRTGCVDLLRLPGVCMLKLSAAITTQMRTDKVAQASITAVAQLARVLGIHTVSKRTDSTAEREWLTALGVDFVQSNAFSPPVAIDALSRPSAVKPR